MKDFSTDAADAAPTLLDAPRTDGQRARLLLEVFAEYAVTRIGVRGCHIWVQDGYPVHDEHELLGLALVLGDRLRVVAAQARRRGITIDENSDGEIVRYINEHHDICKNLSQGYIAAADALESCEGALAAIRIAGSLLDQQERLSHRELKGQGGSK